MQLTTFKTFLFNIQKEGNRLQKVDINGHVITTRKFTQMQSLAAIAALSSLYFLPNGFPEKFAGYTITFLGIFIGMFSASIIALNNWRTRLEVKPETSDIELIDLKKSRNHMVQFTGLTAYGIVMALIVIILMLFSLAHSGFSKHICSYEPVRSFSEISFESIKNFIKILIIVLHRFFAVYFYANFFTITSYSITSYFSHLISDYKKIKLDND